MFKSKTYSEIKDILLLGPPNIGKSTFFNRASNTNAQVGNFSGTTNESNRGKLKKGTGTLIDLPGAHSIISTNQAEDLTNLEFLKGKFHHAIGFLSALHLKRDLVSLLDYMESGMMPALVITQIDEQHKFHIAKNVFEKLLKMHVLTVVTTKLKMNDEIYRKISMKSQPNFKVTYDDRVEIAITSLIDQMHFDTPFKKRFIAIQFLLNRENIFKGILPKDVWESMRKLKADLTLGGRINFQELIKLKREIFIEGILSRVCKKTSSEVIKEHEKTLVDKILLNKFWGVLIFIILMSAVYFLSFSEWTGSYLQGLINQLLVGDDNFIGLVGLLRKEMTVDSNSWFGVELILQGILSPIFLVLSFLPYLFIFFFLTSLMKQSGYFSRVVAVFDSILERFGLSGHSIISLIAGLGCSLPAIISTRSIPSKKERHITAFVAPLIPCSARLSVNTILVALFFNNSFSWLIVIAITIGSGLVWLLFSLTLSRTLFRKTHQWIVLSIPRWRKPDLFSLTKGSWNMIKGFIVRMGGYLVIAGFVIFFLSAFTTKGIRNFLVEGYNDSFLFHISSNLGKIFIPAGFGDTWQTSAALIAGVPAKEVVITTMAATSGSIDNISSILTPASAVSFILFSTFYTPCSPATGLLKKETKGTKWLTTIHLVTAFGFAWILSTIIFQLMSL